MKLSEEHQQKILDAWNSSKDEPPSLMELTELCFGEGFDGRSKEGRAVKDFLATRQLRARASDEYQAKGLLELTKDQEEFIDNNLGYRLTINATYRTFKRSAELKKDFN